MAVFHPDLDGLQHYLARRLPTPHHTQHDNQPKHRLTPAARHPPSAPV
jgi:hypothetical protein